MNTTQSPSRVALTGEKQKDDGRTLLRRFELRFVKTVSSGVSQD